MHVELRARLLGRLAREERPFFLFLHSSLCPAFQCAVWQSTPQYQTAWQRRHFLHTSAQFLGDAAVGAGLAIALACDIRIAATSAFLSTGYLRVALSGDYGISWLMTRLVGTARARQLMFTSERIDAHWCERIGLVNQVVPDDDLQTAAQTMAKSFAEGPRTALRLMKENLNLAIQTDFLSALDHEASQLVASSRNPDHTEAVRAFIEKRAPKFSQKF